MSEMLCSNAAKENDMCQVGAVWAPWMETKIYTDGTTATGLAPLPELSPKDQDVRDALLHLNDIEAVMGGKNGPSIKLRALIERLEA